MELVTLAQVTFSRIGSASSRGMITHKELVVLREVSDGELATIRALVIRLAEENGEVPGSLARLEQMPAYQYTPTPGALVFNIQAPNVLYGSAYAVSVAFPALKIGERYFKLDEVNRPASS